MTNEPITIVINSKESLAEFSIGLAKHVKAPASGIRHAISLYKGCSHTSVLESRFPSNKNNKSISMGDIPTDDSDIECAFIKLFDKETNEVFASGYVAINPTCLNGAEAEEDNFESDMSNVLVSGLRKIFPQYADLDMECTTNLGELSAGKVDSFKRDEIFYCETDSDILIELPINLEIEIHVTLLSESAANYEFIKNENRYNQSNETNSGYNFGREILATLLNRLKTSTNPDDVLERLTESLDELVFKSVPESEFSSINNQGIEAQINHITNSTVINSTHFCELKDVLNDFGINLDDFINQSVSQKKNTQVNQSSWDVETVVLNEFKLDSPSELQQKHADSLESSVLSHCDRLAEKSTDLSRAIKLLNDHGMNNVADSITAICDTKTALDWCTSKLY